MTMNLEDIRHHWQNWAIAFGKDLRATTKGRTAKMIEVATIGRVIDQARVKFKRPLKILEVGCGNGFNCNWIALNYTDCQITGIDYIPEMIEAAKQRQKEDENIAAKLTYLVGDALKLDNINETFDVIFTDRCLINLNTWELQQRAYRQMASLLNDDGFLATIENSAEARERQSQLRARMGLSNRPIDKFNTFISDGKLEKLAGELGLLVVKTQNISSLHDLLLYVLLPMTNGDTVDYEHPLIEAAAQLNIALTHDLDVELGPIGQNRLVLCQKEKRP